MGLVVLALVVVAAVLVVRRVSTSPQERYCQEAADRRAELTADLAKGPEVGLLTALPLLEDLRDAAPPDIADAWSRFVKAVVGLRDALDEAGVDPETYDRDDPPEGVSVADRDAIDRAATALGSAATRTALSQVDQHARDVCGTPLTQ